MQKTSNSRVCPGPSNLRSLKFSKRSASKKKQIRRGNNSSKKFRVLKTDNTRYLTGKIEHQNLRILNFLTVELSFEEQRKFPGGSKDPKDKVAIIQL